MIYAICLVLTILVVALAYLQNKPRRKYNMCIMAIFKNEEPYLEEWLQHHIKLGINHFYLYCNDPKFDKYDYLTKYDKYITIIDWTNKKNDKYKLYESVQRQAYFHCVSTYKNECHFLMMLDIDEFLFPTSYTSDLIKYTRNDVKAVKVPRFNYGSDGHITKPPGDVVSNYKSREKICSSYKTIANTDYLDKSKKFYGVHDFNYKTLDGIVYNPYLKYGKEGYPRGCSQKDVNEVPFVINHYASKSKQEYIDRCKMWKDGGVNPVNHRKDCDSLFDKNDIIK